MGRIRQAYRRLDARPSLCQLKMITWTGRYMSQDTLDLIVVLIIELIAELIAELTTDNVRRRHNYPLGSTP